MTMYEQVSDEFDLNSNARTIEFDVSADLVVGFQAELVSGAWGATVLALEDTLGSLFTAVPDENAVAITITASGGRVRNLDVSTAPTLRFRVATVAGVAGTARIRMFSKREA